MGMDRKMVARCGAAAALLLLVAAVALAGGSQDASKAASGEAMEISWCMRLPSGEQTTWCIQEIERRFNVKLVANGVDQNDAEKWSMMAAANDMPETWGGGSTVGFHRDGQIRSIPRSMIESAMPAYTKRLNQEYPMGWLVFQNPDKKGEYLAITGIAEHSDTNVWYVAFRRDWAANVGVDLPTYSQKKRPLDTEGRVYFLNENLSLDWLSKLLVAFRDKDPDRNNKLDTIPWAGFKYNWWTWAPILGAYGLGFNYTFLLDGELTWYAIHPQYKEFLKTAAKWYRDNLVDKEFVNLDLAKSWDKVTKGMIGASNVLTWYTGTSWAMTYPPNTFVTDAEAKAGVEVVLIPPPVGPAGKQGAQAYTPVGPVGAYNFHVRSGVSDAKTIRILQILDWFRFGDAEGWVAGRNGKPGVHFDWAGEPWDSYPVPRKPEAIPAGYPKVGEFPNHYPPCYSKDRLKYQYNQKLAGFYEDWLLVEPGQKLAIRPYKHDFFNETDLITVNKEVGGVIGTIVDEFYYKAIIGEINIDAEWDAYVANWRKSGGDRMLAEYKKAPIVSELRKGNKVY